MDKLVNAIEAERRIVTTKWLAAETGISMMESQETLEKYWQSQQSNCQGLEATFLVHRDRPEGGIRISLLNWEDVRSDEKKLIYALHHGKLADHRVLGSINESLMVAPTILLSRQRFVHPREMLAAAKLEADAVKVAANAIGRLAVSQSSTDCMAASVLPAKNPAAKAAAKPTASKRGKLSFAPKKAPVDLKDRLNSQVFSTENDNEPAEEDERVEAVEGDSTLSPRTNVQKQSFVVFSSEDEDETVSSNSMQIDAPIETDDPVSTEEAGSPERVVMDAEQSPPGPRMKMIKVSKTFMENGYLMTEMVTEWVPDTEVADENSSTSQEAINAILPKSVDPVCLPDKPAKATVRKQGSLLSFFKSKQSK